MPELDFVYNTGAAWTDLLGTLRYPHTEDPLERLDTPGRLAEWLDAVGLAPAQRPVDADLALAIRDLVPACFGLSGQSCISTQRIYADRQIYDRFVSEVVSAAKALKIGDPIGVVLYGYTQAK